MLATDLLAADTALETDLGAVFFFAGADFFVGNGGLPFPPALAPPLVPPLEGDELLVSIRSFVHAMASTLEVRVAS